MSLPVTLLTVFGRETPTKTDNLEIIKRIINRSCRDLDFESVKVLTPHIDSDHLFGIEKVKVHPMDAREYNRFMLQDLHKYVDTPHVLTFQTDGFILNPQLWDDDFLNYDYIGAPWADPQPLRVGNGGFSLRSQKMLKRGSELEYEDGVGLNINAEVSPEDHILLRHNARKMSDMKIPSLGTAMRFSYENPIPECPYASPLTSFGFHGVFQRGYENDPFRMLIRNLFFDQ